MFTNKKSFKTTKASFRENVKNFKETTHQLEANAKKAIRRLPVVLNEQQIQRLKQHKYSSEGVTVLDPCMQKFWKRLVEYFPVWIAPNLITIVGLMVNIATSVLLMFLTNGAIEPVNTKFLFSNKFLFKPIVYI